MTTLDRTPYWGDDDWAGLLLHIVPVAQLPVPASELARLVRGRVEADSALYDLASVACAPAPDEFEDSDRWGRTLLSSLIQAAMPQGHFLAPQAVLGIVVAGEDSRHIERFANGLRGWESLKRLRVRFYGCPILPGPGRGGIAEASVRAIAGIATKIMAAYEQQPGIAIAEREFLAEVATLAEHGLLEPTPESAPTAGPASTTVRAPTSTPTPTTTPARSVPSSARSVPRPSREHQSPVFHRGEDLVMVDGRSPLRRLRQPAPSDAEAIDRLSEVTDAVSLAYFVLVPDEESSTRQASRECRRIALSLDRLLATVVGDAMTGRPMRVAVEVLTAVSPLHKHGALQPAGRLTEGDLPKVPTDIFDHSGTVDALLGAAKRTAYAFRARRLQVLSLHYLFLSAMALPIANTAGADWDRLLQFARATWVEIGPAKAADHELLAANLGRLPDIAPSPYGFHVVSDRYDVPALVRDESAGLYIYEPPPDSTPESVPGNEKARQRWWRRNSAQTG